MINSLDKVEDGQVDVLLRNRRYLGLSKRFKVINKIVTVEIIIITGMITLIFDV